MNKKESDLVNYFYITALFCESAYERCVLLKKAPDKVREKVLKKLEEIKTNKEEIKFK